MQISPGSVGRSRQGADNNVSPCCMGRQNVVSYRSETTTHEVAGHRIPYRFSDDKTKACGLTRTPGVQVDDRVGSAHTSSLPYRSAEVIRPDHPVRPGEHRVVLRGELGAALAAASGQNGAAGAGTHAETEAVHLGAAAVVRLESSLAHSGISKAQL